MTSLARGGGTGGVNPGAGGAETPFMPESGRDDERGFTLIELMVVVLIIAILIAIAIPTFLGLRQRAQDRAAQSNLRNALTAAKAFYTDEESYSPGGSDFSNADGAAIEPSLDWGTDVVIQDATDDTVTLTADSDSGTTFCIVDDVTTGTTRGVWVSGTCDASGSNAW